MYFKRNAALLAVTLILAPISVFATVIHTSTEDFYSNGATQVGNCTGAGCTSSTFTFGTPSGTVLWEIKEQVSTTAVAGTPGTTTFTWNVLNDTFGPSTNPLLFINSFGIFANGISSFIPGQPVGWIFDPTGPSGYWYWDTSGTGIAPGGFPNTGLGLSFSMTLIGTNFGVTFSPTQVDLGPLHSAQTGNFWMASAPLATPEPGSLALLGTGLLSVGAFIRRKLFHPGEAKG